MENFPSSCYTLSCDEGITDYKIKDLIGAILPDIIVYRRHKRWRTTLNKGRRPPRTETGHLQDSGDPKKLKDADIFKI